MKTLMSSFIRVVRSRRGSLYVLLVAITAMMCLSALGLIRYQQSIKRAHSSQETLDVLLSEAAEVLYLRDQVEHIAWQKKPDADLLALLNEVLIQANIPSRKLAGISAQSDTAVTSANTNNTTSIKNLRKQMMTITLNALTPGELGQFMAAWRLHVDLWSVEQVELAHTRTITTTQSNVNLNRYDVSLVITALYHAAPNHFDSMP